MRPWIKARIATPGPRIIWGEMAKAVVDDLANGMLPNGGTEEEEAVAG